MDRKKVIKGMELLYDRLLDAAKRDAIAMLDASMVANAIALLKEQEPKPVGKEWNECPNCGKVLSSIEHIHFCGMCGQAVKWE